jgi:hypothetical protein
MIDLYNRYDRYKYVADERDKKQSKKQLLTVTYVAVLSR